MIGASHFDELQSNSDMLDLIKHDQIIPSIIKAGCSRTAVCRNCSGTLKSAHQEEMP